MILSVPNVFLVGSMDVGETMVGRAVTHRFDLSFFDPDHEVKARCSVRVPVIFEHEGEVGFRDREAYMIDGLTARDGAAIATGGGAVSWAENRAFLREHGTVIYLCASPYGLYLCTCHDKNQPLLQTENPRAKLEELHVIRDPLYRGVAYFVIETSKSTVVQLVGTASM